MTIIVMDFRILVYFIIIGDSVDYRKIISAEQISNLWKTIIIVILEIVLNMAISVKSVNKEIVRDIYMEIELPPSIKISGVPTLEIFHQHSEVVPFVILVVFY